MRRETGLKHPIHYFKSRLWIEIFLSVALVSVALLIVFFL